MDDAELEALEMRLRERAMLRRFPWLAAFLIACFIVLNAWSLSGYGEIYKAIRVDIPLPTKATLFLCAFVYQAALGFSGLAFLFYYGRNRRTMKIFLITMSLIMVGEWFSAYLPIFELQRSLRKK